MLQERIRETVFFFDLQGIPLTTLEIYKYLLPSVDIFKARLDDSFELMDSSEVVSAINIDTILFSLDDLVEQKYLERRVGFYCLPGKTNLISQRLRNTVYGLKRERRLRFVAKFLEFVPFIRGVAVNGSQALGQERKNSDIDLLIITDEQFMWSARTFVTGFFQILGLRRHGQNIANRFCLNHYVAGPKLMEHGQNLYTALEYLKLRPIAFSLAVQEFKHRNIEWIAQVFPNAVRFENDQAVSNDPSSLQIFLEKVYILFFGKNLENLLSTWQLKRIRQEKYIVVARNELSFHPQSKAEDLLAKYFKTKITSAD